ncbi:2,3-bisphosphoglycerate-dependent phosphoglycerate mutase [Lactobacillus xylocopicola]|uniref:2,3-bisphosphoglycerate-dependent phosphoglycerate mutase n=1 Tax=Lactobacillus xylocopicola TaxID=2976676 RepID=A0ABN6SKM1_9LACO|nr:2,3-diphosphoglycerate-dependent phosphoglycerate mutase [Lactobacillus xylocopicola]BDR60850.1 2,3-bisphosphoglycerate-dependent phosphoglycerate mutase [Lactobacillus xylocopicola]
MPKLVLIRHGESIANFSNVYTGWNDVELTARGIRQAQTAGELIAGLSDFEPTCIHTSVLKRAIMTANIVAAASDFLYVPIMKTWRLNERHYGKLRGLNKEASRVIFGEEQVLEWRRGFYAIPPAGEPVSGRAYHNYDMPSLPRAESLYQTQQRLLPYYQDCVANRLLQGEDQLIVAHGSSLRALIKKLEKISDTAIVQVEVPNAEPLVYTMDQQLRLVNREILH